MEYSHQRNKKLIQTPLKFGLINIHKDKIKNTNSTKDIDNSSKKISGKKPLST